MVTENKYGASIRCDGCQSAVVFGSSWGDCSYFIDKAGWWVIEGPVGEELHYCPTCWQLICRAVIETPETTGMLGRVTARSR